MTNTALLNEFIERSGLRTGFICEKLGISRAAFSLKRNNKCRFNIEEVAILCKLLGITKLTDKEAIFFAERVDDSSIFKS